jgi:hypothetical protein
MEDHINILENRNNQLHRNRIQTANNQQKMGIKVILIK